MYRGPTQKIHNSLIYNQLRLKNRAWQSKNDVLSFTFVFKSFRPLVIFLTIFEKSCCSVHALGFRPKSAKMAANLKIDKKITGGPKNRNKH
jgi:hypothetical protein